MRAKFASKSCPACSKPIAKGAEIERRRGVGAYVHAECSKSGPDPRDAGVLSMILAATGEDQF